MIIFIRHFGGFQFRRKGFVATTKKKKERKNILIMYVILTFIVAKANPWILRTLRITSTRRGIMLIKGRR